MYVILFQLLRDVMLRLTGSIAVNLKFKFDFEVAAMNAVRCVFPTAIITACFFHFCQANSRNVDKKGLKPFYKPGSEVQRHVKMLASLALLPQHLIEERFLVVMKK